MKITKSKIIFFAIAITYNLLLGVYLKDFLVLSETLTVFYLLSVFPTFFLLTEPHSKAMRTILYITLVLDILVNFIYFAYCRRLLPVITMLLLVTELMYCITSTFRTSRDRLLTKIYVLVIAGLILVTGITAYNFVSKPETPYLLNGGATLWDTQTEELADEICADCDTDEEKVNAIYGWMIHNFEYDYDCEPFIQYFNVRKTLSTRKGICYDFAHLFAALCRSQNIPCYVVDGDARKNHQYHHTWNRVYFDRSWWNMDITFANIQAQKQDELYGFFEIIDPFALDKEYIITRIY